MRDASGLCIHEFRSKLSWASKRVPLFYTWSSLSALSLAACAEDLLPPWLLPRALCSHRDG